MQIAFMHIKVCGLCFGSHRISHKHTHKLNFHENFIRQKFGFSKAYQLHSTLII